MSPSKAQAAPERRSKPPAEVPTAGVVPWRRRHGRIEVALVHRKRYDDWAWPKGKLEPDEHWPAAAVRETREEAGFGVRLGVPLPAARYAVAPRAGTPLEKVVRYWAARPVAGRRSLEHEVDRVRWATPKQARKLLTYPRDGEQLDALLVAEETHALEAWPLVVVRHAHALPRKAWSKKDWLRPLDERGSTQAADLVGVLAAYGVRHVTSSSATRCMHTIAPYALAAGAKVHSTCWLSEEGYEEKPARMTRIMTDLLAAGDAALVCSHGPVLPDIVDVLLDRCPKGPARETLKEAGAEHLVKGEALVAHVRGRGKQARVVAAERHIPLL